MSKWGIWGRWKNTDLKTSIHTSKREWFLKADQPVILQSVARKENSEQQR